MKLSENLLTALRIKLNANAHELSVLACRVTPGLHGNRIEVTCVISRDEYHKVEIVKLNK